MALTYNPDIFEVEDERAAREIILTSEGGLGTDERWERETPYLVELLGDLLQPAPGALIVDYGCGIGRVAKVLIERFDCKVLGVDASAAMRAMAVDYVASVSFAVVSRHMLQVMVGHGLRAQGAFAAWVLQHAMKPAEDIGLIRACLDPGSPFAVINTNSRAVPVKEQRWANDRQDVRALLSRCFSEVKSGLLDPEVVGDGVSRHAFWTLQR